MARVQCKQGLFICFAISLSLHSLIHVHKDIISRFKAEKLAAANAERDGSKDSNNKRPTTDGKALFKYYSRVVELNIQ